MARAELALALARLIGGENRYIQMLRHMRADLDTAVSQIILSLNKKWSAPADKITACARAFSLGRHEEGLAMLLELANPALERPLPQTNKLILQECLIRLPQHGLARQEYLLLMLHALTTARL